MSEGENGNEKVGQSVLKPMMISSQPEEPSFHPRSFAPPAALVRPPQGRCPNELGVLTRSTAAGKEGAEPVTADYSVLPRHRRRCEHISSKTK